MRIINEIRKFNRSFDKRYISWNKKKKFDITDKDLENIIKNNPDLIVEYKNYFILKRILGKKLDYKKDQDKKRLFKIYEEFSSSLKMNKYRIGLTFSAIMVGSIFASNVLSSFLFGDSEILLYSFLTFFLAAMSYLIASFNLSDRKIFSAGKVELWADILLIGGIIIILIELFFKEYLIWNFKYFILILIFSFIFYLLSRDGKLETVIKIMYYNLRDKIRGFFR